MGDNGGARRRKLSIAVGVVEMPVRIDQPSGWPREGGGDRLTDFADALTDHLCQRHTPACGNTVTASDAKLAVEEFEIANPELRVRFGLGLERMPVNWAP
jgi:hypothetical protein